MTSTAQLQQLIYFSYFTAPLDELPQLLEKSAAANKQAGITGALLFSGGNVVQVLEGPQERINAVWAKISKDTRHTRVFLVEQAEILEREFGSWSLGFLELHSEVFRGMSDSVQKFSFGPQEIQGVTGLSVAREMLEHFKSAQVAQG